MPKINWDEVPDATDFAPAPEGRYLVKVTKTHSGLSAQNDEMWTLELTIAEGSFRGKKIVDRLTFSQAGISRVKLACKAFGFDMTGTRDVRVVELHDQVCMVDVTVEPYTSKKDGKTYHNNKVAFAGYFPLDSHRTEPEGTDDDDLPF